MNWEQRLRELVERMRSGDYQADIYTRAQAAIVNHFADELEAILNEESEGWVWVPREPTEAMIEAAIDFEDALPPSDWGKMRHISHEETWEAMLKAAPTRPADGSEKS